MLGRSNLPHIPFPVSISWKVLAQHPSPDAALPLPTLPSAASPSPSYQGISVIVSAVHTGHQRVMPDRLAAPLVGFLQPGLEEVQARSEARQHQHGHQQVEGDEPVQEEPRHRCCANRGAGGR